MSGICDQQIYDALVIGAGMSGMAAALRLGLFGKSVLLLEQHRVAGGLNSYYQRQGQILDVGLHALTNFSHQKGAPLKKIARQLRLDLEALDLAPQSFSRIVYPEATLLFSNEIDLLISEIARLFPCEVAGFLRLMEFVKSYPDEALYHPYVSARAFTSEYITNPLLADMLICPLLIYGSAWEHDMDLAQFVIMFRSLYLEGFGRPRTGVRCLIDQLQARLAQEGVSTLFGQRVVRVACVSQAPDLWSVTLQDGRVVQAREVISSAGLPETKRLCGLGVAPDELGTMSFTEAICCLPRELFSPEVLNQAGVITFLNRTARYHYGPAKELVDERSAVLCLPENYQHNHHDSKDGATPLWVRVTHIASYPQWHALKTQSMASYRQAKAALLEKTLGLISEQLQVKRPLESSDLLLSDLFTPLTVERYTGHHHGAVYGSPAKIKHGQLENGPLICGTDQGFLGIVGALLSGLTLANFILQKEKE